MAITMAPFYNVQGSVGSGGTNSRSDVMLVQYMLWHICIQTRPNWDRNYVWTPFDPDGVHGPRAIFPCDGKYTSDLDKWIRCFQQTANERGMGPLTVDGRVNRAPVGWGTRQVVHAAGDEPTHVCDECGFVRKASTTG